MAVNMWKNMLLLISLAVLSQFAKATVDVQYMGRKFVYEGEPFTITCIRSAYSVPKWTKDGSTVIPSEDNNITLSVSKLESSQLEMRLHVSAAQPWHRGEYKCDSLSAKSHRMEVVTTPETDERLSRPKVLLKMNRTLELYCSEVEDSVFQINWYKNGHRILENSDERLVIDGRTLRIKKAAESDAGEYLCAVEVTGLSYPSAENLGYAIQVTYAAQVEKFPHQIRPVFGRNFTLECRARGFPIPRLSWLVDGIPSEFFQMNNSRLRVIDNDEGLPNAVFFIENASYEDDHKIITCIAENMEGVAETSVMLAIRENMINTNEDYPGKGIILNLGSDLVLQCNTTDDPQLNVEWYKNGNTLNMTDSRLHVEHYNNTLVINEPTEADTGSYMCVVNTEELVNATIIVKTRVKLIPFDSSRNIVQGHSIVLSCNVTQGVPQPTLQWFKDGEAMNLSDSRIVVENDVRGILDAKLTIKEADFDDRAEYMCVATNDVGSVNTTILIRVKDKYAALWPFLGICAEVAVLCAIIFIYEKKRQKPDFDESEADHTTENKTVSDQDDKSQDIRQRK